MGSLPVFVRAVVGGSGIGLQLASGRPLVHAPVDSAKPHQSFGIGGVFRAFPTPIPGEIGTRQPYGDSSGIGKVFACSAYPLDDPAV